MTLSRFRSDLYEDLRREFFALGACDLEHIYQIVRELDVSRGSYFQKGSYYKNQSTRANPAQSQYKTKPIVSLKKKITRERGLLKVYPEPTLTLNAINAWAIHVKKYYPSKSNAFYLDEQSDQEKEDTQKEVMFTGNGGSDFDDATGQKEFLASIGRITVVRCTLAQPKEIDD